MQAFGGCNADPDCWDVSGDYLAYGCGPCVIVQNIENFNTVNYIPLKHDFITCVKFTEDGNMVVGASNGTLMLIDPISSEIYQQLSFPSSITHLSVAKNHIAFALALDGVRIFNYADGKLTESEFKTPNIRCVSLAIYEYFNTVFVAYSYSDGSIHVCVPQTGSEVILDGNSWSRSVKFCGETETSLMLASASQSRIVRVWRITTHESSKLSGLGVSVTSSSVLTLPNMELNVELQSVLAGHGDWVNAVDFCGPHLLASASFDGQTLVWSSEGLEDYDIQLRLGSTAVTDDQSGLTAVRLLAPNDVIASSRNGGFSRWVDGRPVRCFAGHTDCVNSLAWSAEDGFFVSVGMDKVARAFGPQDGLFAELARPLIHGHTIHDVAQLSRETFGFASDEKNIRILEATSNFARLVPSMSNLALPFASMVPALTLSNKLLQTEEDVHKEFDTLSGSDFVFEGIPPAHAMWLTRWPEVGDYWGHFRELTTVANGRGWVASGDDRGGVVVRDNEKRRFNSMLAPAPTCGCSSENSKCSSENSKEKCGCSSENSKGHSKENCGCHDDEEEDGLEDGKGVSSRGKACGCTSKAPVRALSVCPDFTSVLAVSEDGTVRVFNSEDGTIIASGDAGDGGRAAAWSADGSYFFTGSDCGVTAFERDGKLTAEIKVGKVGAIEAVGRDLIVGLDDGRIVRISYDATNRKFEEVQTDLKGHAMRVNRIRVSPDGKMVASCSDDHTILLQPFSL